MEDEDYIQRKIKGFDIVNASLEELKKSIFSALGVPNVDEPCSIDDCKGSVDSDVKNALRDLQKATKISYDRADREPTIILTIEKPLSAIWVYVGENDHSIKRIYGRVQIDGQPRIIKFNERGQITEVTGEKHPQTLNGWEAYEKYSFNLDDLVGAKLYTIGNGDSWINVDTFELK